MKIAKRNLKSVPDRIHLKKDDMAYILSGKDKGKTGKVLRVFPKLGKIIVEGVNVKTKHIKPSPQNQEGGIIKVPSPIFSSKAMLYSEKHQARTRVYKKKLENGTKVRYIKKYDEIIWKETLNGK